MPIIKQSTKKLESVLVGVAGEYLVAGELCLRGYIASITLRNTRGIDIITSNKDASKSITIQVKTNSDGCNSWILNKKSEEHPADNHFYIFVSLGKINQRPQFYIVPSKDVANYIKSGHSNWLSESKKDGSARKDTPMRKFTDKENKYLEKWEYISKYL